MTTHPFRDGAPFLLLIETPPTIGRSFRCFHIIHKNFFLGGGVRASQRLGMFRGQPHSLNTRLLSQHNIQQQKKEKTSNNVNLSSLTVIGSVKTIPSALVGKVVGTFGPLSSGSPMSTVTSPSPRAFRCEGRGEVRYIRGGGINQTRRALWTRQRCSRYCATVILKTTLNLCFLGGGIT